MLRTRMGTIYTGIATDVERRLGEHAGNDGNGARYLRGRAPLELVYQAPIGDRSLASRLEHAIKRLPRSKKEMIIATKPDRQELLSLFDLA